MYRQEVAAGPWETCAGRSWGTPFLHVICHSLVAVFIVPSCICLACLTARRPRQQQPTTQQKLCPRKLHVSKLTRERALKSMSGKFSAHLASLPAAAWLLTSCVQLPKGYAVVEFVNREDAERAKELMDGGQLDGNVIQ